MHYTWLYLINQYHQTAFHGFPLKETFFGYDIEPNGAARGEIDPIETSRQAAWGGRSSTFPPPFH